MKNTQSVIDWILRIVAAAIMAQTLYFKFTASEESVYIFSRVGMEPWGRIGVGSLELVASVLLLMNVTAWLGAALGLGMMVGAIGMHLTLLGIKIPSSSGGDDGGLLFIYALAVALCSAIVLWYRRKQIVMLLKRIKE